MSKSINDHHIMSSACSDNFNVAALSTYRDDFGYPFMLPPVPNYQEPCLIAHEGRITKGVFRAQSDI